METNTWNAALDAAIGKVGYGIQLYEMKLKYWSGVKFPWYRFRAIKNQTFLIDGGNARLEVLKGIRENIQSLKK